MENRQHQSKFGETGQPVVVAPENHATIPSLFPEQSQRGTLSCGPATEKTNQFLPVCHFDAIDADEVFDGESRTSRDTGKELVKEGDATGNSVRQKIVVRSLGGTPISKIKDLLHRRFHGGPVLLPHLGPRSLETQYGERAAASAVQINRLQLIQPSALPLLVDKIVDVISQSLVSRRQESSQFPMREW